MEAYYIQWIYDSYADDSSFYGGDKTEFFHKEENAIAYAKEKLKARDELKKRYNELIIKDIDGVISPDEEEELEEISIELLDTPYDYNVCKREIKFIDEE